MLTVTKINSLKPKDKPYREADRDGLYLLVEPAGQKKWQFRFSWEEAGNKSRPWQSLGSFPAIGLEKARQLAQISHQLLAEGINPIQHAKKQKIERENEVLHQKVQLARMTFSDCYDEYCHFKTIPRGDAKAAWHFDTLKKHNERFKNFVLPVLGDCFLEDVTEANLRDVLLSIQEHGTLVNRNKVRTVFNGMFDYAVGKGYIKHNIAKLIPNSVFVKHEATHFKHVTSDEDFAEVVRGVYDIQALFEVKQALKLALFTFLRPSNVAGLKWSQVDIDAKLITISASEMKMSREFVIPLATQALTLLEEIHPFTGHTPYVFYSPNSTGKGISRDSLSNALRRNGMTQISPHGLRHTASTLLHEKGFSSDAIELQLSHVIGGVRGVYNKARYLDQRREMMQAWADMIDVCR
jgi:integrase